MADVRTGGPTAARARAGRVWQPSAKSPRTDARVPDPSRPPPSEDSALSLTIAGAARCKARRTWSSSFRR